MRKQDHTLESRRGVLRGSVNSEGHHPPVVLNLARGDDERVDEQPACAGRCSRQSRLPSMVRMVRAKLSHKETATPRSVRPGDQGPHRQGHHDPRITGLIARATFSNQLFVLKAGQPSALLAFVQFLQFGLHLKEQRRLPGVRRLDRLAIRHDGPGRARSNTSLSATQRTQPFGRRSGYCDDSAPAVGALVRKLAVRSAEGAPELLEVPFQIAGKAAVHVLDAAGEIVEESRGAKSTRQREIEPRPREASHGSRFQAPR